MAVDQHAGRESLKAVLVALFERELRFCYVANMFSYLFSKKEEVRQTPRFLTGKIGRR